MPIFQAVVSASYNVTEETILVSDLSDYITNTQTSHLQPEFDVNSYYKVEVLKPDSSTHVWSNQSGADILIPSVSVDIFNGTLVLVGADPAGDYDVSVTTVPAWQSAGRARRAGQRAGRWRARRRPSHRPAPHRPASAPAARGRSS